MRVKLRTVIAVLSTALMSNGVVARSADLNVEHTTLCNILNHPSDFIGKSIEIRAQIWPDSRDTNFFWMNESSTQLGAVCPFLHATFTQKTSLIGQTAFATFRGTIVKEQSHQASTVFAGLAQRNRVIFLVDEFSDIYRRRDYLNGPILKLQLYDQKTASFVRPEN